MRQSSYQYPSVNLYGTVVSVPLLLIVAVIALFHRNGVGLHPLLWFACQYTAYWFVFSAVACFLKSLGVKTVEEQADPLICSLAPGTLLLRLVCLLLYCLIRFPKKRLRLIP